MTCNFLLFTIAVENYYSCNDEFLILSSQLAITIDFVSFYNLVSKRLTYVLQFITRQVVIMHNLLMLWQTFTRDLVIPPSLLI